MTCVTLWGSTVEKNVNCRETFVIHRVKQVLYKWSWVLDYRSYLFVSQHEYKPKFSTSNHSRRLYKITYFLLTAVKGTSSNCSLYFFRLRWWSTDSVSNGGVMTARGKLAEFGERPVLWLLIGTSVGVELSGPLVGWLEVGSTGFTETWTRGFT